MGVGLKGEEPHLWPITVLHDDFMLGRDVRHRGRGGLRVPPLGCRVERLPPLEKRVASEGDDDAHVALRSGALDLTGATSEGLLLSDAVDVASP